MKKQGRPSEVKYTRGQRNIGHVKCQFITVVYKRRMNSFSLFRTRLWLWQTLGWPVLSLRTITQTVEVLAPIWQTDDVMVTREVVVVALEAEGVNVRSDTQWWAIPIGWHQR